MGKLSEALINEIEELCRRFNSEDISAEEKEILYQRLQKIYEEYFIELPNRNADVKGS